MLKYIKAKSGEFVVFSGAFEHATVARGIGMVPPGIVPPCDSHLHYVASAGFVRIRADGSLRCIGASESLGLESLSEDTEQLREWLS